MAGPMFFFTAPDLTDPCGVRRLEQIILELQNQHKQLNQQFSDYQFRSQSTDAEAEQLLATGKLPEDIDPPPFDMVQNRRYVWLIDRALQIGKDRLFKINNP